jgi:Ser/Thr protein kinase RdoA (MazF antagonist)
MKKFKSLTKRGKALRYRKVLIEALREYSIKVRSLRFVSLESKPVFRVDSDSGCFAAKFHNPKEHLLSQMYNEMRFLDFISNNSDLYVEKPLVNKNGEFVTEIHSAWLPEKANVALCSWILGKELGDSISKRNYGILGKCSALLHKTAYSFRPRNQFLILKNNKVFYWDKETLLSINNKRIMPKNRQTFFRKAVRIAQKAITYIWKAKKPIVIHNDLHPCNVKVYRSNLALIDFEDICWGHPEQDIGTAMYHARFLKNYQDLRDAFRAGYEQVLSWPFKNEKQLDFFIMARLLMFANYVINYNYNPVKNIPKYENKLRKMLK